MQQKLIFKKLRIKPLFHTYPEVQRATRKQQKGDNKIF